MSIAIPRALRLACAFLAAHAGLTRLDAASFATERFRVRLDQGGALTVVDRSSGLTWRQPALPVRVADATATATGLTFTLNETWTVRVTSGEAHLDLDISGPPDASIEDLEYPAGFTLVDAVEQQQLVLPHCAGMAIPFSDRRRPDLARIVGHYTTDIGQGGLMMPWIATTDGRAGCLMQLRTPVDSRMRVWSDDSGYQYTAFWHDTKGRLGYPRQVRFHFRADGGAVALCKAYREEAKAAGLLVTLREKSQRIPNLERFLGAISLWIVDWPDLELVRKIRAAGVERALVSYHVTGPLPSGVQNRYGHNTTYEPMNREFTTELRKLGFLAGRYDYYRTIYPPEDSGRGGNGWIMRFIGYPEQLSHDAQGRIRPGFQGGNRSGNAPLRGQRCSKCQYELAQAYIPVDVERAGYDARLLDAVCAVTLQECYNPAHPTSRAEDLAWRRKQLQVAMTSAQITGTEHMASWAVPDSIYAEAPTTFVRLAGYRESFNGQSFTPPDSYRSAVLDERLRFPLWQLVFHDAVVITNRWTFTANRYTDESIWDQEDLINLLHGQMPTFMLDRSNFESRAARFARTARTVGAWNARTGFEEMTDFRWVTPDGSVQQAVYASGANVIVNFGTKDHRLASGETIPARGFLTSESSPNP